MVTLTASAVALASVAVALCIHFRVRTAKATITELQTELQAERHAARHDPLTGLLNRREFLRCAAEWTGDPDRYPLFVVVLDLDSFKQINDEYGHAAGDEVLITVAQRFVAQPGEKLVARFGGDEFVALVSAPNTNIGPTFTVTRLTRAVAAPMRVFGRELRIIASVGAYQVHHSHELFDAVREADEAMYRIKTGHTPFLIDNTCTCTTNRPFARNGFGAAGSPAATGSRAAANPLAAAGSSSDTPSTRWPTTDESAVLSRIAMGGRSALRLGGPAFGELSG